MSRPATMVRLAPGARWQTWLVLGALLALTILAWVYLLDISRGMSGADGMSGMSSVPEPWSFTTAWLAFLMWTVMMAGMMLPSAAPVVLLVSRAPGNSNIRTAFFILGYLIIWTAFSAVATLLQGSLQSARLLSEDGLTRPVSAAVVLMAAGIYQWTPLKSRCLAHCRSPLMFLLANWRPGLRGILRLGLVHGAYCVGCCWVLMLLLFVSGVMDLLWAAVLAAFVLLEKVLPAGQWLGRIAGVALLVWGATIIGGLI